MRLASSVREPLGSLVTVRGTLPTGGGRRGPAQAPKVAAERSEEIKVESEVVNVVKTEAYGVESNGGDTHAVIWTSGKPIPRPHGTLGKERLIGPTTKVGRTQMCVTWLLCAGKMGRNDIQDEINMECQHQGWHQGAIPAKNRERLRDSEHCVSSEAKMRFVSPLTSLLISCFVQFSANERSRLEDRGINLEIRIRTADGMIYTESLRGYGLDERRERNGLSRPDVTRTGRKSRERDERLLDCLGDRSKSKRKNDQRETGATCEDIEEEMEKQSQDIEEHDREDGCIGREPHDQRGTHIRGRTVRHGKRGERRKNK